MKTFFMGGLLLWSTWLCAQAPFTVPETASFYTFLDSFDRYYPSDTLEGGYYNQMQRTRLTWEPRLAPDGKMSRVHQARTNYVRAYPVTPLGSPSNIQTQVVFPPNHPNVVDWDELGPTDALRGNNREPAKGMGQIHRLAFHPQYDGSTNQTLYAGSHYGGLFRSNDGGQNWFNYYTDRGLPMTSIGGVAASNNHVFICTGNGDYGFSEFGVNANYQPNQGNITNYNPLHTQGVYRCSHTASSSSTWVTINGQSVLLLDGSTKQDLLEVFEAGGTMREILVHSTNANILLIATSQGIFRTADGGQNWQQVLAGTNTNPDTEWRGLVTHPTQPNTIYASGKAIYRSTDAGLTWSPLVGGASLPSNTTRINLAVTPAAPDRLYAYVKITGQGALYVYDGTQWSLELAAIGGEFGYPGWLGIAVSPIYPNVVHFGAVKVHGSWDILSSNGATYTTDRDDYSIHDDVHALVYPPNGDTVLFAATHGGVSKKSVAGRFVYAQRAWTNLYTGLSVATIWAFDDWEGAPDLVMTANQDIGINHSYDRGQVWYSELAIGDGYSVRVDQNNGLAHMKGNVYQGIGDPFAPSGNLRPLRNYNPSNPFDPSATTTNRGIEGRFDQPRLGYDFSDPSQPNFGAPLIVQNVFPAENHPKTDAFYMGFTELYFRAQAQIPDQDRQYVTFVDTLVYQGPRYNPSWNQIAPAISAKCSNNNGTFVGLDTFYYNNPLFPNLYARIDTLCALTITDFDYGQLYAQLWSEPQSDLYQQQPFSARRRIMELAFSQDPNTDYTYIATLGDVDNHRCDLFFQDRAVHCDTCFVSLTSHVPYDASILNNLDPNPITGIAVDPLDGNRVWMSMSGYSSQLKVLYSADAGQTWVTWDDSTNALANLNVPINNIVYQQGTKDRLYIATDVGVYVREGTGRWLRYGENFPNVRVTELKINYCVGKLRAATFGRGVWENDLLPTEEAIAYRNFRTITGQETWSETKHMSRDIRILSGASLNLDRMTLNMPKDGLIVIEAGGSLHVNGSTITNACGQVWQGIQVWGDNSLQQSGGNQGAVHLTNSTIEHAKEALRLWEVGNFPRPDGTGGAGGMVFAQDSRFLNNWRSAEFMQYQAGGMYFNEFKRCTFTVDDNSRQDFLGHISAWDIAGLNIKGCTFKDERSQKTGNPYGIYTLSASGHVSASRPWQQYATQGNKFEGLSRAIEIGSDPTQGSWVVDQSDFTDNWRGVIVRANAGVRVLRNQFEVNLHPSQPLFSYGLGLMHQGAFVVEQNKFTYNGSGPNNFSSLGIWVDDTKGGYNRLRNNFFESTHLGIYVNGDNGEDGLNLRSGLQFWCNEFLDEAHDFSLFNDPSDPYGASVADDQGNIGQPAKNRFSTPLVPLFGQDWHMNNDGSRMATVNYWVPPSPQPEEVPTDIININRRTSSVPGDPNFCTDYYTGTLHFRPQVGNNPLSLTDLKQAYYSATEAYQNEKDNTPLDPAAVATKAQSVSYWANEVVFWYQNDTLSIHPDSTFVWLQKIPGLLAEYRIVEHLWNQGQYNKAFDRLNNIGEMYTFSIEEQNNHNDYSLLKDVLYTAYEANRNEALLEREEVDVLRDIANRNHGVAALQAANIINFFYEHEYTYLPVLPEGETTEKLLEEAPPISGLAVYPNPSRVWADVIYELPESVEQGRLLITAVNGRVVQDITLTQSTGRIALDTQDWLSGIYFVALMTKDTLEHQTTLIIRR